MTTVEAFGRRAYAAWKHLESIGRFPQAQVGIEVAEVLGELEPIPQGTVSKWLLGKAVPPVEKVGALAIVLRVDPGWLAFGEDSQAPPPSWWSATVELEATPREGKGGG